MRISKSFLIIGFLIGSLLPIYTCAKDISNNPNYFQHNIQLQLSDQSGFPVAGTQFWVTLDIVVNGPFVTILFPVIDFQTGPSANNPLEAPPLISGGYLYTSNGFLPANICPTDLVNRSIVAASNNGMSPAFSFVQPLYTLPTPPAGYIVQVTNAGGIVIQCAGTFGNIIPPGPQIMLPCSISYLVKPTPKFAQNFIVGSGFSNTTQFTGGDDGAAGTQYRDSHVNDAYNGVVAWAWTDNSMETDKTNNVLNVMVAVGSINANGVVSVNPPVQLTNFAAGTFAWDTAVAINRTNPNNIVVSWSVLNNPGTASRAVSFDGGKTWPINGATALQPAGGTGDNRGVAADKYGNIWYGTTSSANGDQPLFWISTDGGDTFQTAYSAPLPPADTIYDYPEYCFGGDENGNYGLWFCSDFVNLVNGDINAVVGFIPIGLGTVGLCITQQLPTIINNNELASITASSDGRVWMYGSPVAVFFENAFSYIAPFGLIFKSPGAINVNYAGVWQLGIASALLNYFTSNIDSIADAPYINNSVQSILYDESRQALYALLAAQNPDNSQNMIISLIISRNNGQTWSNPIQIDSTNFGNRHYQSMALDTVTGNLVFGWYDGRNDPTFESVQYFGAVLPAAQLTSLVNTIPLSNPLYTLPAAGPTGVTGCIN